MLDTKPVNPLLQRLRMPGSTFRLPSQGLFYTNGELDPSVKNGEVEVYPMTTIDEIIISTPDKLLSGKALIEVFERCIPSILKPNQLLARDVDYLMVALRIVSYGDTIDVHQDHECSDASEEHRYEVNLHQLMQKVRPIDPTAVSTEYKVMLSTGQQVSLRPLVYDDMMRIYQTTAVIKDVNAMTSADAEALIINGLVSIISDVDGVTDREQIVEWIRELPIRVKREIDAAAHEVSPWGVDFTMTVVCKDCQEEMNITVAANPVSFFS